MKLVSYTPEVETNEYDEWIPKMIETGEALELDPIPVAEEEKHRRRFGKAANRHDRSPYLVKSENPDPETVVLTYRLIPKRGRKPEGDTVEVAAPGA